MDVPVRGDGGGGDRRQPDRHLDSPRAQAHADSHQLLPRQLVHRGRHGVHAQRHLQLRLHAEQRLAVRNPLLQDHPVCRGAQHLRQCLHVDGHRSGQVSQDSS